jgi:sterol desaturase/sphingolipid hydroxylase (fatty acid hydroxylase superfamily)
MQAEKEHESIRIFENNILESLTHVHPIVPLIFWSPIAAYLLWRSFGVLDLSLGGIALSGMAAVIVWTLTEYVLHRYAFHFPATSKVGKWLVFLFHGNHHHDPKDKTRLVFPPGGSIPIMIGLYYLFALVVPAAWIEPFMAFFIISYLTYDYIHYAVHHFPMKSPVAKFLKHYHLKHHYAGEEGRYGVSSPLWDYVFGTTGSAN